MLAEAVEALRERSGRMRFVRLVRRVRVHDHWSEAFEGRVALVQAAASVLRCYTYMGRIHHRLVALLEAVQVEVGVSSELEVHEEPRQEEAVGVVRRV